MRNLFMINSMQQAFCDTWATKKLLTGNCHTFESHIKTEVEFLWFVATKFFCKGIDFLIMAL